MQTVGRYQILDKLGQGGMGTVYKAYDPLIERVVAVKVISTQLDMHPEWRDRFFREARSAGQLSHPNIITIYDLGEEQGQPYLAMEYLEGRDLERRMRGSDAMTVPRKLEIAMAVCEGLAHAHTMGIVHRDVKPANVFVTDGGHVKILDFGLARVLTSDLTHSHVMLGTMNYMAPEQIRGEKIDHRADIFAVGVLCYELLCGRKAFHSDSFAATMYQILQHEPEPVERLNPNLPPQLSVIIGRAMEKSREDRYQHMTDLLHDLDLVYEQLRGIGPRGGRLDLASPGRPGSGSQGLEADISNAPTIAGVLTPSLDAPRLDSRPGSGSGPRSDRGTLAPISEPAPESGPAPAQRRPRAIAAAAAVLALMVLGTIAWLARGTRSEPEPVRPTRQSAAPAASSQPVEAPPAPAAPEPAAQEERTPPAPASEPSASDRAAQPSRERADSPSPSPSRSSDGLQAAAQAFEAVAAARGAAASQRAADLAPDAWAAAAREEQRARAQYDRGRYAAATAQLYAAAGLFKTAEGLARDAAAAAAARERQTASDSEQTAVAAPPPAAPAPEPPPAPRPEPLPVTRPPVAAATPAPGPPPEEAVLVVLRRYVAALEGRDMAALKSVWPGLEGPQQAAIQNDFANARTIDVQFGSPKVQVNGATATVTGRRRYAIDTRDGHRQQADTITTITLKNVGGTWQIESMRHQPVR